MTTFSSMECFAKTLLKEGTRDVFCALFIGVFFFLFSNPFVVLADPNIAPPYRSYEETALRISAMQNQTKPFGVLPQAEEPNPLYVERVAVTAYSSEVAQTDSTPFITASQTHVRDGVIAANFLPFGSKVKIPELYGDKVFVVEDRMNARYTKRIDIWMDDTSEAKRFGVRKPVIEVYPR